MENLLRHGEPANETPHGLLAYILQRRNFDDSFFFSLSLSGEQLADKVLVSLLYEEHDMCNLTVEEEEEERERR